MKNPSLNVHGNIGEEFVEVIEKLIDAEENENNINKKQFAESGLNSNKLLKNYDCWDDDLTPEEWI